VIARDGRCIHVLVMGVAGSGKSTVAAALSDRLGLEMIEGDALHPAANVEKMRNGIPLTEDDRRPWLESLASLLADRHSRGRGTVLACSALRHAYRDALRVRVAFVTSGDVLEEPLDIEQPSLQHDATMFVAREIQQVFHDALEPSGFAIDRLEIAIASLGVERNLGHAQRFDVSAHRGQRRLQFM